MHFFHRGNASRDMNWRHTYTHQPFQRYKNRPRYGVIFRTNDNQYLCVQQSAGPKFFGFVKGSLEECDSSGWDCAIREVQEEIGVELTIETLKTRTTTLVVHPDNNCSDRCYTYYLLPVTETFECVIDNNELCEYRWITLDELERLPRASFTSLIIPRLRQMEHENPLKPKEEEEKESV